MHVWFSRVRLKLHAMRFLTEQSRGSFLPLSTQVGESTVFEELIKKHPNPSPATPQSLINPTNWGEPERAPHWSVVDGTSLERRVSGR